MYIILPVKKGPKDRGAASSRISMKSELTTALFAVTLYLRVIQSLKVDAAGPAFTSQSVKAASSMRQITPTECSAPRPCVGVASRIWDMCSMMALHQVDFVTVLTVSCLILTKRKKPKEPITKTRR